MYSFEGDFRRKPQQNLAGASAQRKTDRNALILQSQQQRQKREEHRKRLNSTIKIQAYIRSFLIRKHCKQDAREQFDKYFLGANPDDQVLISSLVAKVLFFYDDKQDCQRLVSISQLLLKQWKKVFQSEGSCIQIRRLLALHLRLLKDNAEVSLAVPLRMFEVFTSVNSAETSMNSEESLGVVGNTFLYLIRRGYFKDLRELMCQRTPPLYGPSPNPPTPLCGALLDLIQRPLNLTMHTNIPEYDDTVMSEFAAAFLCNPYLEPIEMYLIPSLSHDLTKKFPFLSLIQCLRDDSKFNNRILVNDSWLLHSVLSLEPPDFANDIRKLNNTRLPNNPIILEYLKIIAKLTINVCNKQITYEYEDSLYSQEPAAEKDEDSDSDSEPNPTSVREQLLLARCIELLNEPDHCVMVTCTQITDSDLNDEFLDCMSQICHNLLLSHRMALHKYRLLYTLAFKPTFLRELWHWLSGLSHESSFGGSATPLLSALSRGLTALSSVGAPPTAPFATDGAALGVQRLLAPLAVFCALFSLLIGTLHDTEFCRDLDDDKMITTPSVRSAAESMESEEAWGAAVGGGGGGGGGGRMHAFSFAELGALCRTLRHVCLGLVELACPDTRQPRAPAWSHLFKVCTHLLRALYARDARLQFCGAEVWGAGGAGGVSGVSGAVGAGPEGVAGLLAAAGPLTRYSLRQPRRPPPPASAALALSQEEGPPLTIKELRTVTILREIPFVVPFSTRVLIFQGLLIREKHDHWYELNNFNEGPSINISVRRTHLYEDAFDKLSPSNEPDLKLRLRVQLINQAGAEEAGVDGGGLFREFLSELLKSAFDPNRGLFRLTKDNMLYPNPGVHLLYDDFTMHYYFVGRMLGKALYENLLVELPLAEFFLSKLCSRREPDVHALASLDPALYRGLLQLKAHRRRDVPDLGLDFTVVSDELGEQRVRHSPPSPPPPPPPYGLYSSLDPALYRGLLQLKAHRRRDVPDLGLDFTVVSDELGEQRVRHSPPSPPPPPPPYGLYSSLDPALYRGLLQLKAHRRRDVPDLGLDFTVVSDELGEQRIEELKPGGANIPVTAENRIEYIHLVADYKLNRQIRPQCVAFKRGLTSVVNAEWLRMFSCGELQLLVSGAEVPIDLHDLRAHTLYTGGFSATHPTVRCFWKVVENFTDDQRRQLLKFVTSCSRPPLLGFKDLQPPFCIQSAGASDRLPSSSTCMNLLKLPEIQSEDLLAEKLLYAIQAGAGFELS
ncbi:ubiquitin-protein ligase E3C [Galleria mellonella]|uniref:HECT-type E3 ubiquitin transferase n=1 Tax=Galleria mellonella TaxID=7137 RepID=A0ABM3N5Y7_GALME|nr:ubiquitin-protein ligase E3C [Galleria mellonella]